MTQYFTDKSYSISPCKRNKVPDPRSTACFARSTRFMVYKHDSYVGVPSKNVNFHTEFLP